MDLFGIGPMELLLILIVALMVFGPDKLPQIGAKLGRAMREMRRATRAISDEINSTRAAIEDPARELAEPFQEVAGMAKAVRNPGAALRESVLRELNPPAQPEAQLAEGADTEENTIAPPPPSPAEPAAALPAPEEPDALLPAILETQAAPDEPVAAVLPARSATGEEQEQALNGVTPVDETPDGETRDSGAAELPHTSTPPEN